MKNYLNDRSTLLTLLADAYAIMGVLVLNWDPYRLIGFYWLDNCVAMLFLFILFGILEGPNNKFMLAVTIVFSFVLGGGILFIYLQTILQFPMEFNPLAKPLRLQKLLYPYFDISLFLVLAVGAHFHRLKTMLPLEKKEILPYNVMSFIIGLVIIPAIFIVSGYLAFLINDLKISIILSLILFRNLIEYWRYRNLNEVISRTAGAVPNKNTIQAE